MGSSSSAWSFGCPSQFFGGSHDASPYLPSSVLSYSSLDDEFSPRERKISDISPNYYEMFRAGPQAKNGKDNGNNYLPKLTWEPKMGATETKYQQKVNIHRNT